MLILILLLLSLVTVMTAMWPINKFATKNGARAEALGMMICVSGLILSIIYLLAWGISWATGRSGYWEFAEALPIQLAFLC